MPPQDEVSHYHRAQAIFLDALELPPAERPPFLDEACADEALRREVEGLLAAHAGAGLLDDALLPPDDGGPRRDPMLGRTVGPWRLEGRLGAGGMGAVYRAVRDDGLYEREVAVKLLRPGADVHALGRRLRDERQILARLEHPAIARLYDGGVTADGLPYLVLELVEGEELTRHVERRAPELEGRLALFLDVCAAVAYAHRNLVVHRDLKPSNILVTEDEHGTPRVKLLDFGIARLIEDDEEALTRTAHRLLTPAYAAPEQLTGGAITTATDVYALGVVLYELLVGHRPYDLHGKTAGEMERIVCTSDPAKPSTAVQTRPPEAAALPATDPERRARRLRGDLDTIVLKALAKEPERRYASAEALAADLRRHLDGLPVTARPATAGYRVRKFVRRHRVGVAAATLVVLALVGGLGTALWQARAARTEAAKAAAVNDFLIEMLASPDPYADGREVRVAEVLDRTAQQLDRRLDAQPAIEAAARHTLGVTYRELGVYDMAEVQLRRALALRERLHGPRHPDVADTQGALASTLQKTGEYGAADSLFRLALAADRAHFGAEHARTAGRLSDLGTVRWEQGDYDGAEPLLRDALALEERLRGPDAAEVATSLGNLAALLSDRGDLEEAERLYRRELAILRDRYGDDHPGVPQALAHLGILLDDLGDHDAAIALHRQSLALYRAIKGEDHSDVGYALNNLAAALTSAGRTEESLAVQDEAIAIYEGIFDADHPNLGIQYNNRASARSEHGDLAGAEAGYREAVAVWRAGLPPGHPYLAYGLHNLGAVLLRQDRPREALASLREAYDIRAELLAPANPERANTASVLGDCLARLGRDDEAEPLLVAGYEGALEALGPEHTITVRAQERLVDFLRARGRPAEAVDLQEAALEAESTEAGT